MAKRIEFVGIKTIMGQFKLWTVGYYIESSSEIEFEIEFDKVILRKKFENNKKF